jgi:putative chitinase
MDVRKIQTRLAAAGRDPGPVDGIMGPKTYRALLDHMARRPLGQRGDELASGTAKFLPAYSINTELRLAHFLAQATHETGDFCYMKEIWGPTPAQKGYEGRADLGNTQPGDGKLYCGRGIFQLTGRANYANIGAALALPLESQPEMAAQPYAAVQIACNYWMKHGINQPADADNIQIVTRLINGGQNGLASRQRALARAKEILC